MNTLLRIITFLGIFSLCSCHVGRYVIYNFADVNDYRKSPQTFVSNDPDKAFRFQITNNPILTEDILLPEGISDKSVTLSDYQKETGTTAFLIVRNDTILHENYFGGSEDKILTSFSVSKSFIAALIHIATKEKSIISLDDPITKYIDYWDGNPTFSDITIAHLMDMRSGIKYDENYKNPVGDVAKYYYGRHLEKYLKKIELEKPPGTEFEYVSINTILLSLILENATGTKTEKYLEQKLWIPMGMEFSATLNKDRKKGTVKAFAGLNARLRDYAKFGRLYLNYGRWDGQQLIPEQSILRMRNVRPREGEKLGYADQWWTGKYGDFAAIGYLGQYIYVYPAKELIIVRTGKKSQNWFPLLQYLALSEYF